VAADALLAPASWEAELANVVWKAVLWGSLAPGDAEAVLSTASLLPITGVPVRQLWLGAVMRSVIHQHPAYDGLFVELAAREGALVASYDQALQRRYPDLVKPPDHFLTADGSAKG